jgi:hypothetical protein
MAKKSYTTARLDGATADDASRLLQEMRREGAKTSRDEIVRVLLWGVTAPQAVGMLRAYIAHAEASSEESKTNAVER